MIISKFFSFLLKNKTIGFILTLLIYAAVLVAIAFRGSLLSISFEYDELFTAITTDPSRSLGWVWSNWLIPDVHPPLYNAFLWVYNHFVPYGPEIWLRLPSTLFSVGALVCGWFMFPRRFGKTARVVFVSLLACNQYMILYAQHARAYALMLLLSVPLTFWFLDISRRIWHNKGISAVYWGKFAVVALLLAWTHYFGTLLVGIFYILLFLQAWHYKRGLKVFIILPLVTGLLFLPWIVPNFLAQLQVDRFAGDNWWANRTVSWDVVKASFRFFFFAPYEITAMAVLVFSSLGILIWRHYKGFRVPFKREMLLLALVVVAVLGVVGLVSLKMFLFIGRYFTEILPSFVLLLSLLTVCMVRSNNLGRVLLLVAFAASLQSFYFQCKVLRQPSTFPARLVSQFYRDFFRGKEVMVIAVEAFPPQSMPAMYGYYINQVYKLNVPVTELAHLSEPERERVLQYRENAFIFMPNCEPWKVEQISERWNKTININGVIGMTCFITLDDKTETAKSAPEK